MALILKDSVITTGSKLLTNEDILERYTGDIEDAKAFLEGIGRSVRFLSNGIDENTLTMGIKVALDILKINNLTGQDVDLIAFCSQFPEYSMPSQALMVHNHINGKTNCVTFDLNANCLGMLRGLDIVNRYFNDKSGEIRRALLIGSDYSSKHMKTDELVTLGSFADGACALLLEYAEDRESGIIGSASRSISDEAYGCLYPECGLSSIDQYMGKDIKTSWTNPDTSISINAMKEALDDVLKKHNLKVNDIDWFCGSQFAEPFFNNIGDACDIPPDKRIYVGNKYGYTGTSSPFFAFTEGRKDGRIKKGDIIFFTTVGVGISICSMLVRV